MSEEKVATIEKSTTHYGEGKDFNENADDDSCCCCCNKETQDAPKKTCCGCASAGTPQPGKDMSAKAIYERAIYLNVTAKNRKCRDVCCIILYSLFVLVWIAIAGIAFYLGDWQAMFYGTDYKGRVCGTERAASGGIEAYNFLDKKRIYYPRIGDDLIEYVAELGGDISSFDVSNIDFTQFSISELTNISLTGVCVSECPSFGSITCKDTYTDEHGALPAVKDVTQCYGGDMLFGLIKNSYYYTHLDLCSNCWVSPLNSTDILWRCLDIEWTTTSKAAKCLFPSNQGLQEGDAGYIGPYDSGCITREVDDTNSRLEPGYDNPISSILGGFLNSLQTVIMDIWNARSPIMVIGIAGSMILGLLWVILVRFCVACIVWTTLVLVLVFLFFFGVWSYLHSDIFDTSALTNAIASSIAALDSAVGNLNATMSQYGIQESTLNFLTETSFNFTSVGQTVSVDTGFFNFQINTALLYTISAVTCTVLFVAVLIVIIIFCKKIRIAIAIIKEASKAIEQMPSITLLPFVTAFFTLLLFVLFFCMAAFIYSLEFVTVGTIVSGFQDGLAKSFDVNCTGINNLTYFAELQNQINKIQSLESLGINISETEYAGVDVSQLVADGKKILLQDAPSYAIESLCSGLAQLDQYSGVELDTFMLFFHVFAWLWTNQIVAAIGICIISGAVADWYFTRPSGDPSKKGGDGQSFQFPILRSVHRTFRFHLGSLIFGSAIVAIVQFIRYIMMWVQEKTKDWQEKNQCFKTMFCVIQCLLKCFEECLKYITVNAYIMIAMRGFSFCDSCCRGVKLLFNNMAQFMLVACFSKVIIFLGKLVIVAATATSLYFWLSYDPFFSASKCDESLFGCDSTLQKIYGGTVTITFVPILIGGFLSYLCARAFLFVYHMTIQTILLCFCEDCRVHQIEEPTAKDLHKETYMSRELRRIMLPSKEYSAMKDPMTLEEVMALDPDSKKDPSFGMDRELDCEGVVELTKKILHNSDEGLQGELDVDKLKDTKALLTTAGGPPLWDAYNDVQKEKTKGIKYVDVVRMIHEHLGGQGLLKKWPDAWTQEAIDNHFDTGGFGVTAKEVKSVQHGRFEGKSKVLSGGDAKLQLTNLHKPRETDTPHVES